MPEYRYELRRGKDVIATGHLSSEQPLEIAIGSERGTRAHDRAESLAIPPMPKSLHRFDDKVFRSPVALTPMMHPRRSRIDVREQIVEGAPKAWDQGDSCSPVCAGDCVAPKRRLLGGRS